VKGVIIRGKPSWDYIYVTLGFALTIEGAIIQMIEPIRFPCNIFVYLAFGAVTSWFFIWNGWFHEKLLGLKSWYEGKTR
jgi:hypothetical protein